MSLVSQQQLSETTGYIQAADIRKWLDKNNVKYWPAKNNTVFTTTEAINSSLLSGNKSSIEFA